MRKKNSWIVRLQAAGGDVRDYELESHWDAAREGIKDLVAQAAAIQAWWESDKRIEYQPVAEPVLAS